MVLAAYIFVRVFCCQLGGHESRPDIVSTVPDMARMCSRGARGAAVRGHTLLFPSVACMLKVEEEHLSIKVVLGGGCP